MNRLQKSFAIAATAAAASMACIGPENVQGVAFTAGEEIDFARIETLGQAGVDYLKESTDSSVTYRLRTATDGAMLFLTNRGVGFMEHIEMPVLGVKVDSALFEKLVESNFDTTVFNFSSAVLKEVNRMVSLDIMSLKEAQISAIEKAFATLSHRNGGQQYWTKQGDVMAYNTWFDENGGGGVWGGVKGVDADMPSGGGDLGDGCGGSVLHDLPAGELVPTALVQTAAAQASVAQVQVDGSMLQVTFEQPLSEGTTACLYSPAGRQIVERKLSAGARSFTLPLGAATARGVYLLEATINGNQLRHLIAR